MKRTNIHFTESQLSFLHRLSEKTGLKIAELVRRAVDAYVTDQNEKDEN